MKSTRKKFLFIILAVISVFLGTCNVTAADNGKSYSWNDWNTCVKNGTCYKLCGYTNTANNKNNSVYIYYHYSSSEIRLEYYTSQNHSHIALLSADSVITTSKITNAFRIKGICPKRAFVDTSGKGNVEVCLDDGASTNNCEDNFGANTKDDMKFNGSSKLEYNFSNDIDSYFNSKKNETLYCNELYPSQGDSDNAKLHRFRTSVVSTFQNDNLNGNSIPSIVNNSESYQNGMKALVNRFKSICLNMDTSEKNTNEDNTTEVENETSDANSTSPNDSQSNTDYNIEQFEIKQGDYDEDDCKSILTSEVSKILKNILDFIKYLGPILVTVFSIIDLIKAVASGNTDMKKIAERFAKRLIAAILIFFIIQIVQLLLGFAGIISPAKCFEN